MGFEMYLLIYKMIFEGVRNAASVAYAETLEPYHTWATASGIRALFFLIPGRESICATRSLCPGMQGDIKGVIERDVTDATREMLPMVRFMKETCKEYGLWESSKV